MQFIEDENDNQESISISNAADWLKFSSKSIVEDLDPFNIEGEELKKLNGLGSTFRRKMGRDIQKRFIGQEGTGTQQNLLAQAITGYAMFDLIEPPYNLDYLSKIYEISPYNHSSKSCLILLSFFLALSSCFGSVMLSSTSLVLLVSIKEYPRPTMLETLALIAE